MSNFKSQAKRKRELAKLDKRQAKDQKRAARKAERSATDPGAAASATVHTAQLLSVQPTAVAGAPPPRKPMTLAEAAERWKNTRIVKPKRR